MRSCGSFGDRPTRSIQDIGVLVVVLRPGTVLKVVQVFQRSLRPIDPDYALEWHPHAIDAPITRKRTHP